MIDVIERNAAAQFDLVEDLLDLSRITTGKLRLTFDVVNVADLVESAVQTIVPAAAAKRITIERRVVPASVAGDYDRLQQVLWNLLSNAVKFTNRGGEVHARLGLVDGHVEVAVSDTGIGIATEFLPQIFERFRQGDGGTTREHGGLGLGLAIARQLVEMHGGTIDATSTVGSGSTFRVRIPALASHAGTSADRPSYEAAPLEPPPLSDLSGLVVLVVDDEQDARLMTAEILQSAGAEVLTARSASEALALIAREPPGVLVADLAMPQTDGFELIERVRQHPDRRVRNVPAAALTAFARSEDRTRALRAGFHVHLAKPIDPDELVTTIAMLGRYYERK